MVLDLSYRLSELTRCVNDRDPALKPRHGGVDTIGKISTGRANIRSQLQIEKLRPDALWFFQRCLWELVPKPGRWTEYDDFVRRFRRRQFPIHQVGQKVDVTATVLEYVVIHRSQLQRVQRF